MTTRVIHRELGPGLGAMNKTKFLVLKNLIYRRGKQMNNELQHHVLLENQKWHLGDMKEKIHGAVKLAGRRGSYRQREK